MSLPIAGLLSSEPLEVVVSQYQKVEQCTASPSDQPRLPPHPLLPGLASESRTQADRLRAGGRVWVDQVELTWIPGPLWRFHSAISSPPFLVASQFSTIRIQRTQTALKCVTQSPSITSLCVFVHVAQRQHSWRLPFFAQDAPHRCVPVHTAAEEGLTNQPLLREASLLQDSL